MHSDLELPKPAKQIPSTILYKDILKELIEKDNIRTAFVVLLAGTCGLRRIEIANVKTCNIGSNRGLLIDVTKRTCGRWHGVRAKEGRMHHRIVPINRYCYNFLMSNIDINQKYIIKRMIRKKGRHYDTPIHPYHLDYIARNLPFTILQLRHYFKATIWEWMIRNKQPDIALLKEYLGHKKNVTESYGKYSWEYKLEVIDKAFATTDQSNHRYDLIDLQDSISRGIIHGFMALEIEKSRSFIADWISKVMKQTPSDLYVAIINDYDLWANLSDDLKLQSLQYKEYFSKIDASIFLQLIKENNLNLYSTIINTPNGTSWIYKQLKNIKKQITIYTL